MNDLTDIEINLINQSIEFYLEDITFDLESREYNKDIILELEVILSKLSNNGE